MIALTVGHLPQVSVSRVVLRPTYGASTLSPLVAAFPSHFITGGEGFADRSTSMDWKFVRYSVGIAVIGIAACVFEFTPLDLWLQDRFFDAATASWVIDGKSAVLRLLFYSGPKVLLGAVALSLLAAILGPESWRRRVADAGWNASRASLMVALASAALTPVIVGALKGTSGVFCPSELVRYGGTAPYRRPYSTEICEVPDKGHCWPAGHASGGFALLGLLAMAETSERRRMVIVGAVFTGSAMALYQMLKGAHFMSHTLVTAGLAILVAALGEVALASFLRRKAKRR